MVESQADEDRYDPDGKTSAFCRPLLKDQKDKLAKILEDKKPNESKQVDHPSIDNNHKSPLEVLAPGFMGKNVQKSVAMVV